MSTCLSRAALTLSIDLEHDAPSASPIEVRSLDETTTTLLDLLARYDMPATWAMADPAVSAARVRIVSARRGHELALQGDASWVGHTAGRARFARELERRAAGARDAGCPIHTLVLKTVLPIDHCDLAIKEGIVAARLSSDAPRAAALRPMQPHTLRFGLWGFRVSALLPGTSRWWPGGGGTRAARLAIDEAVASSGVAQLVIDVPRLASRGSAAVRALQSVLRHAERRRQRGLLEIATLGTIAGRFARGHHAQPSRSILRPAA